MTAGGTSSSFGPGQGIPIGWYQNTTGCGIMISNQFPVAASWSYEETSVTNLQVACSYGYLYRYHPTNKKMQTYFSVADNSTNTCKDGEVNLCPKILTQANSSGYPVKAAPCSALYKIGSEDCYQPSRMGHTKAYTDITASVYRYCNSGLKWKITRTTTTTQNTWVGSLILCTSFLLNRKLIFIIYNPISMNYSQGAIVSTLVLQVG